MDYRRSVQIADGIYWVGCNTSIHGLHSNPYLIIHGGEAVLIDGGSRPDFSTVMMKILQTGLDPKQIVRLIYQHYDPDLVGSVSHFESIINNHELQIISQKQNNPFIEHYGITSPLTCINAIGGSWGFRSGRRLHFYNTPYVHSPGSFMTYDEQTKTLFSADLFGGYMAKWDLFVRITEACGSCTNYSKCPHGDTCFMPGIIAFHQLIMPSRKALTYALDIIKELDIEIIAPQHGSLIKGKEQVQILIDKIYEIQDIGIDRIIKHGVDSIC